MHQVELFMPLHYVLYAIYEVTGHLPEGSFVQNVVVQIPKFESAHQISSKSDDSRPRYSDKTIFNMAAVRHLEFSKFGILVI